ncbi:MAG: hypothetical protein LBN20_01725 [Endomicrobium sp.]|jgi:hypothetical protein|nr:hypothetical protein [Endomicrobium sp.]
MNDLNLKQFGAVPITFNVLESILKDYSAPKDKIAAMEKDGSLIRLKKGLYVVSPQLTGLPLSNELIANHLYGISYVSLETALFFYGLIPEKVYAIRSMTMKRAKTFDTPCGKFEYIAAPENYFPIGIKQISDNNLTYLIASPEKAICDMLFATSRLRLQSVKAMRQYLQEDLRIDMSIVKNWDIDLVKEILAAGHKKTEITQLMKVIENEK